MMIKTTSKGKELAKHLRSLGIRNDDVLDVIAATPRELFLPAALRHKAYENNALPIGQGQTISQPYTVAKMTELLLEQTHKPSTVLEIGTGSGYQTAILAQLFTSVFSVERIKTLQFQAKRRMNQLDLHNVKMKHGDGWQGWPSKGPFDAIIVTAAAEKIPKDLIMQLSTQARFVIPVGNHQQTLKCIDRLENKIVEKAIEPVNFVPLIAGAIS